METTKNPLADIEAARQFTKELRKKTGAAIQRGIEKKQAKDRQRKLAEERKQAEEQLIADGIIAKIPEKCEAAAEKGLNEAVIMKMLHGRDYRNSSSGGVPDSIPFENLQGPALIVYNKISDALATKTKYWYSGDGVDSGYDLVVSW